MILISLISDWHNFYLWFKKKLNMKFVFLLLLTPLLFLPAFAESNSEILPTDNDTLDVKLSYEDISPRNQIPLHIEFINPQTDKIQEHIDYRITVSKDGNNIFGPIPLTHTSLGTVNIPVEFPEEGNYFALIEVEGILFQPIPLETVSFSIAVGESPPGSVTTPPVNVDNGGGCLIATATFGSELAPQVQQLRELRDNTVLKTNYGVAFMSTFNQFYYSFSPLVADFEREQPIFREFMKLALTPMISSLSILNHVEINSEHEMLGYGISIVLLNIAMYIGIPVFGVLRLYQYKK